MRHELSAATPDSPYNDRMTDEEYWPKQVSARSEYVAIDADRITMQSGIIDHSKAALPVHSLGGAGV